MEVRSAGPLLLAVLGMFFDGRICLKSLLLDSPETDGKYRLFVLHSWIGPKFHSSRLAYVFSPTGNDLWLSSLGLPTFLCDGKGFHAVLLVG